MSVMRIASVFWLLERSWICVSLKGEEIINVSPLGVFGLGDGWVARELELSTVALEGPGDTSFEREDGSETPAGRRRGGGDIERLRDDEEDIFGRLEGRSKDILAFFSVRLGIVGWRS